MPQLNTIPSDRLFRLIGTPSTPVLIDVRSDTDFAADPRLIPGAVRRDAKLAGNWAAEFAGRKTVIIDAEGSADGEGVAAWIRQHRGEAERLEGGFARWREAGLPLVPEALLPERDAAGRTVWVTRSRPKVDRIACPWLIRRFVDPDAAFLFVAPAEVQAVAERTGGAPFDISGEGVTWSHQGELCTFDVMVRELGLGGIAPLERLAVIVRGADTDRLDTAPQAAGLLAVSLGLSRMFADDVAQLDAGMLIYDALFRWCRDAVDETHDWVSHAPRGARS